MSTVRIVPPVRSALLVLAALVIALPAQAEVGAGVFMDQNFYIVGQETPLMSVTAFNTGAATNVDVHVGILSPEGTIYEYPDWNTNLQPALSNFTLDQNLNLPLTPLANLPSWVGPGIWSAFVAFTAPGTIDILHLELAPFNMVPASVGGSAFGSVSMSYSENFDSPSVDASGGFIQSQIDLGQAFEGYEGEQPPLDQCVYEVTPLDFSGLPGGFEFLTLDAGNPLTIQSSVGSPINMPQDPDAASFGFIVYNADPATSFYQGGATYTFQGPGGAQLSPFTVQVQAPDPLNLTQPAGSFGLANHNAASDLPLVWNGNNGVGEVDVIISATASDLSNAYSITCRFVDDGSDSVPANLLTQLKNDLGGGSGGFPIDLPPGFEIPDLPGLGATASLSVSRSNFSLFNTQGGELGFGIAEIDAGTSLSLTLQ